MAIDTTPKQLPLPPVGGDRATWIRWGIQVALLLAAIYLGAAVKEKTEKVEETQAEMKMQLDAK